MHIRLTIMHPNTDKINRKLTFRTDYRIMIKKHTNLLKIRIISLYLIISSIVFIVNYCYNIIKIYREVKYEP